MHGTIPDLDARVQKSTLLETVIGNVEIFVVDDGIAREQRVAMIGGMAHGVAAVGHIQPQGRGKGFVLRVEQRLMLVAALDFLQEDQIWAQAIQAQAKFIQGVAPA